MVPLFIMSHQDWEQVVFRKPVAHMKKDNPNKPKLTDEQIRLQKVDKDDYIAPKISLKLSKRIQQARLANKLSQVQLAQKLNVKPSVINEYESGRAVPNQQLMNKLDKALNTKLRGK